MTKIDRASYREIVWSKPAAELLYVGPDTDRKLSALGIYSIGDLARADAQMLRLRLGKMGTVLHDYANGMDSDPVLRAEEQPPAKSIGNGMTTCRDMRSKASALPVLMSLAESVGARLRHARMLAGSLTLELRTAELKRSSHGRRLHHPTDCDRELLDAALELLEQAHSWPVPLRSLSLRTENFIPIETPEQIDIFMDYKQQAAQRKLDTTIDRLRFKYGSSAVRRGAVFASPEMAIEVGQHEHTFVRNLD